jgi:isoquinoline 1-oxidoreductase
MALVDIRAALDGNGAISAWDFVDVNAGPAGIGFPYVTPNRRIRYQPADSPVVQGSYRGLGATANHFARESHVDEMARAARLDPVEFRLRHLEDKRLGTVVEAAADRFGWASGAGEAGGMGIAAGLEKGARVATCAEVRIAGDGSVRVTRLATAYECGAVVNPDTVRNQVEGGMVMALGGALFEQLSLDCHGLAEPSLARYRVPRFSDVPDLDVVLLDRPDIPPAGAGETPLVATAPAIANAIFAASGRRLRSLPLLPDGKLP